MPTSSGKAIDTRLLVSSMQSRPLHVNQPTEKKTPSKSGLIPIRPNKSPGNGIRFLSGLTPLRPETQEGNFAKSPFRSPGSGLKHKSGLTPVRPGLSQSLSKSPFQIHTHCPVKLKSGLLPIKPSINMLKCGGTRLQFSLARTFFRPDAFTAK